MARRLTDEQLGLACMALDDDTDPYPASLVRRLALELRERRAADLTDEEREALMFARRAVNVWLEGHREAALRAIDKLLGGAR